MAFLIDSDVLIDNLDELPDATQLIRHLIDDGGIYLSVITYMEVYEGVIRLVDPQPRFQRLQDLVAAAPVLEVTREIAERCARLREALRRARKRPDRRSLDLIIAATALVHGLTIVTRNVRDYADIDGIDLHRA